MKTKLILCFSLMAFSTSAFASWFQTNCHNGEGTIQRSEGHSLNRLLVTQREVDHQNGEYQETPVELPLNSVTTEILENKELFKEVQNGCQDTPNSGYGYGSFKKITYEHIRIRNVNGSPFPKNIVDTTDNGRAIEAFLICEHNAAYEVVCGNPNAQPQ